MKGRTPRLACGPFLLLSLLAGCGDDSRPSSAEEEQLDNAAEMLNSAPAELERVDENALGNTEPEAEEPAG